MGRVLRTALFAAALLSTGCDPKGPAGAAPPPASPPPPFPSQPAVTPQPFGAGAPTAPVASSPAWAPNPPAGSSPSHLETVSFQPAALGVTKRYMVYLPRGYDDSQRRFPVLYLLHGLGGNETNWAQHGNLKASADASNFAAIIVMPDGDDSFYVNSPAAVPIDECLRQKPPFDGGEAPSSYCVKTPAYEDYMARDLVGHVDGSLRTLAGRGTRAIGGLSMGGFGALSLAMRHPDLFSAAASHSGMASLLYTGPHPFAPGKGQLADGPSGFGGQYPVKFREHVRRVFGPEPGLWRAHDPALLAGSLAPGLLAVYLDCGSSDDFHFEDNASYLHELLAARGVTHTFTLVAGTHSWKVWSAQLPESLRFFAEGFARAERGG